MTERRRFAIYTRKSSEEGLEQDFNSLHAQREACEAYIASQRHEGWRLIETAYDDGGLSGGTMERPALQQLLADIDRGLIDGVVVYKVDRLTRSLTDFARIVERFDARTVSFVSVTQSFNTTSSMGRLTLNMLLSFAQFEREITGERIRDKIRQSKAKGLWMGGYVPFGYEADGRTLKVRKGEAETVRWIFERYLALGTIPLLKADCDARGMTSPERISKAGNAYGGCAFSRGYLHKLLSNPVYQGQIQHKGQVHDGQHEAIIGEGLFDRVQRQLARRGGKHRTRSGDPLPLLGRLFDRDATPLTATHARKGARRYHYYVGGDLRLPAPMIERLAARETLRFLGDEHRIADALRQRDGDVSDLPKVFTAAARLRTDPQSLDLLRRLTISPGTAAFEIRLDPDPGSEDTLSFEVELGIQRRGVETKLVIAGPNPQGDPDPVLLRTLARAFAWSDALHTSPELTAAALAECDGTDPRYLTKHLALAGLSPKIVRQILQGTQPVPLTADRLLKLAPNLPLAWDEQEAILGIG